MPTAKSAALSNSRSRRTVHKVASSSEFITPVSAKVLDGPIDGDTLVGRMPEARECVLQGEETMRDNIVLHEVTFVSRRDHVPGLTDGSAAKTTWNQNSAWYSINEKDPNIYAFEVQTVENGYNSGRSYYFRTQTQELRNQWVIAIGDAVTAAKLRAQQENSSRFKLARIKCKQMYDSSRTQGFVACLIFGNFIANIAQAESQPSSGTSGDSFFNGLDTFFTDGWSCFDFLVVVVSLVSTGVDNVPGVSVLRLMRAFRVLRLFGRLKSLRQIINALTAAIIPVCNAFLIMGLVTCLYAILAVNFYMDRDYKHFGSFFRSLFTMFQVSTGDDWASIARGLFLEEGVIDSGVVFFFVSFHVIVGWTLLQVVVAVLIDNFTAAADEEKTKEMQEKAAKQGKNVAVSALDPVLAALAHFNTSEDLSSRISTLFKVLDCDDSKSLSYEELAAGLRKLKIQPTVYLSKEDFDLITSSRALCSDQGELTLPAFDRIMREQLKLFVQRQMAHAMGRTDESDPSGTVLFVLKLLTITVDEIAANQKSELNHLVNDTKNQSRKSLNGNELFRKKNISEDLKQQPDESTSSQDPCINSNLPGTLSDIVTYLEKEAAQLQANVDSQKEVLQEILSRLPQARQTFWLNQPSSSVVSAQRIPAATASFDGRDVSTLPTTPKGPKFWLGTGDKEKTNIRDGNENIGVGWLSSRLLSSSRLPSPSSELTLGNPVLTPRLRVVRTPRSHQKTTPRQASSQSSHGRGKDAANDANAEVPKSSLDEGNHQQQSDHIKWTDAGDNSEARNESAEQSLGVARSEQGAQAGNSEHNEPEGEGPIPANAAERIWSEIEKAVTGKGQRINSEAAPSQPREISSTPVQMLAALFSPVKGGFDESLPQSAATLPVRK